MSYQRLPTHDAQGELEVELPVVPSGAHHQSSSTTSDHDDQKRTDEEGDSTSSPRREEGTTSAPQDLPPPPEGFVRLNIMQLGTEPKKVDVGVHWTVLQVKQHAFPEEVQQGKNIRFIYRGMLLVDANEVQSYNLEQDSYVHCVITDPRPPELAQQDQQQEGQEDGERIPPWLMDAQLREFHSAEPPMGTSADFALGFVMGLILGFLSIIWLWQRSVPRKQKLGIMTGLCMYLVFSMMRTTTTTNAGNNGGNNGGNSVGATAFASAAGHAPSSSSSSSTLSSSPSAAASASHSTGPTLRWFRAALR